MASLWRPLPLRTSLDPDHPLVKTSFGADNYDIQMTDLVNVWTESLHKEQIIKRAHIYGSSIDPSQDANQMQILLQKLNDALLGVNGTELKLLPFQDAECAILEAKSPLPAPLNPLTWTFHLDRLPNEAIRSDVIVPLLGKCFVQNQQIEQLKNYLLEKDTLINKILDKVESLGLDAATVFPTISASKVSRKGNQRDQLAQHIRGLAAFDEEIWKKKFYAQPNKTAAIGDLIRSAFVDESMVHVMHTISPQSSSSASGGGHNISAVSSGSNSLKYERSGTQESTAISQRDEFEKQEGNFPAERHKGRRDGSFHRPSPPAPNRNEATAEDDKSTEDEDDLDAPYLQPSHHDQPESSDNANTSSSNKIPTKTEAGGETKPRKLGTIGKSRPEPVHLNPPNSGSQIPSENNSSATNTVDTRPTRRKLGTIGKRVANHTNPQAEEISPTSKEPHALKSDVPSAVDSPKSSAPHVGSPSPENKPANPVSVEDTTQGSADDAKREEADETAEERADRKRAELKRQLENKAKSQTKKKRRF